MFKSVLDPFHRSAEPHGEIGNQKIFRVDMALAAEATANVRCYNSDTILSKAKTPPKFSPDPMHHLGR